MRRAFPAHAAVRQPLARGSLASFGNAGFHDYPRIAGVNGVGEHGERPRHVLQAPGLLLERFDVALRRAFDLGDRKLDVAGRGRIRATSVRDAFTGGGLMFGSCANSKLRAFMSARPTAKSARNGHGGEVGCDHAVDANLFRRWRSRGGFNGHYSSDALSRTPAFRT